MSIQVRRAVEADAPALTAIYNQGILSRMATFETETKTVADRALWLRTRGPGLPVLAVTVQGRPAGFAWVSAYRDDRSCYRGVGEFSIYVDDGFRGRGLGKALLTALVDECRRLGYWKLLSRIFEFNAASRGLCRSCGFREVGIYQNHGQIDGRWIDCVIVEYVIRENLAGGRSMLSPPSGGQ